MKRTMIARVAAVAALAVSPIALAAPAHATTPSEQAIAACGSAYHVQDSEVMGYGGDGIAFLLYNSSNGYNCAVTVKTTGNIRYGQATGLGAGIIKQGGSWDKDDGDYKYFAGPVYVHAAGACVQFWGHYEEIGAGSIHQWQYTSPWEHCG